MRCWIIWLVLLFVCAACTGRPTASASLAGGATANPALVATAQANQYWRDAEATSQAQQMTVEANYQHIQGTAHAAASTIAAQQTHDALNLALTADAATVQAQETQAAATAHAGLTATTQAQQNDLTTATAVAAGTTAALQATRQTLELAQAQSQAQREQLFTFLTILFLALVAILIVVCGFWFFWKVMPTLINRASLVRYGQHGNPLLLTDRDGRTVITDPLRMLQAVLTIDAAGGATMPEITPNEVQTLVTGGVLQTLIEQARYAPGHRPQLPAKTIRERRAGPFYSATTTQQNAAPLAMLPQPRGQETGEGDLAAAQPLPNSIPWQTIISHSNNSLNLGANHQEIVSLNLARTPHILLSGSSGAGKTRRALRPFIAQALGQGICVVLLNESGADFAPFYDHPHAFLLRGSVQTYMAFIESTLKEMHRREMILRQARVSEWRRLPAHLRDSPPILIVIDELLSLAMLMTPREQKAFWGLLAAYASRARKLSMGSIGALTDPTYRILGAGLNWREQCNARISFRVAKAAVSRAVLDADGAEALGEGHFLAMLGAPQLVRGVAANPTDAELLTYLAQRPVRAHTQPAWVVQALTTGAQPVTTSAKLSPTGRQPPEVAVPPPIINLQPPQPVATSNNGPQPDQATRQITPQPVVQPADKNPQLSLPFDPSQPPNETQRATIRQLYASGKSKNAVCRVAYGFKDGRTFGWVSAAIAEVNEDEGA